MRKDRLLAAWKDVGLWLHEQGTLEDVLGLETKGRVEAQTAAATPGLIDAVAKWCAFDLDPRGDVEELLNVAVERIAHAIMEALRTSPDAEFAAPVGGSASSDSRLVSILPTARGVHRLVVKKPNEFAGHWLEFSRDTPSSQLTLEPPAN